MMPFASPSLGRGASPGGGTLDTQTVTTGGSGGAGNRIRGFVTGGLGSISDGTSNLYSGAAVQEIAYHESDNTVLFRVAGNRPNSGWTQMVVGGKTYLRASASYAFDGANSIWSWATSDTISTQPFGAAGTVHAVTFS